MCVVPSCWGSCVGEVMVFNPIQIGWPTATLLSVLFLSVASAYVTERLLDYWKWKDRR